MPLGWRITSHTSANAPSPSFRTRSYRSAVEPLRSAGVRTDPLRETDPDRRMEPSGRMEVAVSVPCKAFPPRSEGPLFWPNSICPLCIRCWSSALAGACSSE